MDISAVRQTVVGILIASNSHMPYNDGARLCLNTQNFVVYVQQWAFMPRISLYKYYVQCWERLQMEVPNASFRQLFSFST
jgi:hypothetical protein